MIVPTIVILVAVILAMDVDAGLTDKLRPKLDLPEVQKCITSTGYTPTGPPEGTPEEFTPEQLCFFKCIMEEKGLLDSTGNIIQDELNNVPLPIPDDKKDDIKKCAASAGKIVSCGDIQKFLSCLPM
uniref:Odorant-binding protein n=1 Tax=Anoplophora chinensis TaxID=217632 RepID=A0A2H4ZB57_ANOCN|nr:odorant-binding protein [Anoplophora chinensis]